ncbi:hypothetical protein ACFV3R_01275 [Streptomyces sp. NPDC059740]|uniref:hypothetical protein n=1 Tax=Streptomyces sp. NPDC059740 TaxID=3346926 RepID=UPI0036693206
MELTPQTARQCRVTFPRAAVDLAVGVLETYRGQDPERVHLAAMRLSGGRLNRLSHWIGVAERDLGTFLWYAGETPVPREVERERSRAVDFVNGVMDAAMIHRAPSPD